MAAAAALVLMAGLATLAVPGGDRRHRGSGPGPTDNTGPGLTATGSPDTSLYPLPSPAKVPFGQRGAAGNEVTGANPTGPANPIGGSGPAESTTKNGTAGVLGLAGSQSCLDGPGQAVGPIAWSRLRNPILSYDNSGVRDIAIRWRNGAWHLFFTSVVGNGPDWRVASANATDLSSWTDPLVWPAQPGTQGLASPDVTRRPDGTYVVTYQSDPGEASPPGQDKLYYRTSTDLSSWSPPRRLMPSIHPAPSDRLIDAALAWTAHGLFLGYKYGTPDGHQHFEMAWSPSSSLAGPWRYLGRPNITVYGDTIENYQFLSIDGVWNLLATSNMFDRPWLFSLTGDPSDPQAWLQWSPGRELEVPAESWNRAPGVPGVNFELANSAYLCDARRVDGHFYLLYVGANELQSYGGWGHTRLGIARSTDLTRWEVPCPPGQVSTPAGCSAG